MQVKFFKYQGTGNDFIVLDNRKEEYSFLTSDHIRRLCDRRFGIGADGLMFFNDKNGYDFAMKYFNSDGKEGSMCGNGGRCMLKFAYHLNIHKELYKFLAADGEHEAEIDTDGIISLKMKDVKKIKKYGNDFVLDTGSPHYVKIVPDVTNLDVNHLGSEIRHKEDFEKEGINVNFVEAPADSSQIVVRTYERGVENETYSCGTGVTASALVCYHNESGFNEVEVKTLGGSLTVEYERFNDGHYENIWLCGPAEKVYEGVVDIEDISPDA
ncbi:MAG: diaminopimelate epimerase [Bacteroidetes bacterium]|nr:diaminopimelate epimerase [Bacteroidota bacterium]